MAKDNFNLQPVDSNEQGCASKTRRNADNQPLEEVTGTISFRIAVFYDGTGNNKLNTVARRAVDREQEKSQIVSPEDKAQHDAEKDELEKTYSYRTPDEVSHLLEKAKETYRSKKKEFQESIFPVSYLGAETNVYKMYKILENCTQNPTPSKEPNNWKIFDKVYIEGIGTTAGKADDTPGGAMGIGESGIIDRVDLAKAIVERRIIKTIQEFIYDIRKNNKSKVLKKITIDEINLDFFGFSRGAACARYSCKSFLEVIYGSTNPYPLIHNLKFNLSLSLHNIEFDFRNFPTIKNVGIFDTVAAYWLSGTEGKMSNTKELYLDSITAANNVCHVTAVDEFRVNFALTNNKSKGNVFNLFGAHSDIGGGYENEENEKEMPVLEGLSYGEALAIAIWFKNEGWVNSIVEKVYNSILNKIIQQEVNIASNGEITRKPYNPFPYRLCSIDIYESQNDPGYFDLKLNRQSISNEYATIPLNLMLDSEINDGLKFNRADKTCIVPASLNELKTNCFDENTIKKYRNKYLHFSGNNKKVYEYYPPYRVNRNASSFWDKFDPQYLQTIKTAPFKRIMHDG